VYPVLLQELILSMTSSTVPCGGTTMNFTVRVMILAATLALSNSTRAADTHAPHWGYGDAPKMGRTERGLQGVQGRQGAIADRYPDEGDREG
jgi:hypothetical protein